MRKLKRIFLNLIDVLSRFYAKPYFGFIQGHSYLTKSDFQQIHCLVGTSATDIVTEFEANFASLVGDGSAVSFAAGRMGFYALMKTQGIGVGDEVILLGATCAVMVIAILRTGAIPIFADTDPETFGSSAGDIARCLTSRTRMIVAQHSFGIPCDINPIVALSRSRNIFLLEDCALALGSTVNGLAVGNFGNAALFSTDHGKPLNTMIGGIVYTRDLELADKLRAVQADTPDLPVPKQQALWQRFRIESRYCCPAGYGRMGVIDLIGAIRSKLFNCIGPFLSEDFCAVSCSSYHYSARLPGFLAAIGIHEIKRWPKVAADRKELLHSLLEVARNSGMRSYIPNAYLNKHLEIVPLRFAWTQPGGALIRDRLSRFVHVAWTAFMQPIIATPEPMESFGYKEGSCPISERIGPDMVNLPCNLSQDESKQLVELFQAVMSETTQAQRASADTVP